MMAEQKVIKSSSLKRISVKLIVDIDDSDGFSYILTISFIFSVILQQAKFRHVSSLYCSFPKYFLSICGFVILLNANSILSIFDFKFSNKSMRVSFPNMVSIKNQVIILERSMYLRDLLSAILCKKNW